MSMSCPFKLDEHKRIVNEFDTTLVEELNREILDANDKVTSLEKLKIQLSLKLTECASVISLKDVDFRLVNEKVSILEEKCENFGERPFHFERQRKG